MTKKALIFIRDYTDQGKDRFFIWSEKVLKEASAEDISSQTEELVCHDYWLIAPIIFRLTGRLPKLITDVEELRISISGKRSEREKKEKIDITNSLQNLIPKETIQKYIAIFNRKEEVCEETLSVFADALVSYYNQVEAEAKHEQEWDRLVQVEQPVARYLISSAAAGINISTKLLRGHKNKIEFDFYMALKHFSSKYSVPLEVPSDEDIVEYLEPRGFDFSGVNVDYVLNFVPMQDEYADDLLNLRKIHKSRMVLAAIPLSQKKIFPLVDSFGSITSRIYFKDPSLQNLAKQHRNILIPDKGKLFSYVDYDQYEAGIMAALSGDSLLTELYAEGDLYEIAAESIFRDVTKRKEAKRLFLSYAYGMRHRDLIDAAYGYGAERQRAKVFFKQFSEFEGWKSKVYTQFETDGKIGTALGNYIKRERTGTLSEKEKRSSISQQVQGTASLIFKKALITMSGDPRVELKVPMHDAVLFQHQAGFDPQVVAKIFAEAMSNHFEHKVTGKASLASFGPPPEAVEIA
ncbi:DNA polymerase [Pseudomonas syringae]|uniref:DNA polymerase n=1 Tax=Pseudomonas syringae TaxID=317 RepID=UPI000D29B4BA|nr:DNA polymerase [Pseudomonas syringae]POD21132.1 DNA polymerase I [Pseudomonas syringae pv. syringae]